ncbi:MAG TPA: hypothetical protein DEP84_18605 [Chloroflexi bacterium]|nr:hypothetical protein [Chloroflexota bacterium]
MDRSTVWVLVGTGAGAYLLVNDHHQGWQRQGPFLPEHHINCLVIDTRTSAAPETLFAGGPSGLFRSRDGGGSWRQLTDGLIFDQVWSVEPGHSAHPGRIYCGVEPAGLFVSDDDGEHWAPVHGLNQHETHDEWWPGGGGLCLHTILLDPSNPECQFVGISVAGVFRSEDGGTTWTPLNEGVPLPDDPGNVRFPQVHRCVHKFVRDANQPECLFQQNHVGVFESRDGGATWADIGAGLPHTFGFAIAAHPHESDIFWVIPADEKRLRIEGQLTVWRRQQGCWEPLTVGLPADVALNVYRDGFATDCRLPCGLYFGTSDGTLWYSPDEGNHWEPLAQGLPPIYSVKAVTWPTAL